MARTVLEVDGEELHVYRRNIPFGTVTERGYVFVGFAADQTRVTRMLERMFGADAPPGADPVVDALTAYTRPVSSSSYFVPSLDALAAIGVAPRDQADPADRAATRPGTATRRSPARSARPPRRPRA